MSGAPKPVSPLAPATFPELPEIPGLRLAAVAAGVRYPGRLDVMLAEIAAGAAVAGVLTRSRTRSAPVLWCAEILARERTGGARPGPYGILVNSGNANAFTGRAGQAAVAETAAAAGAALGADPLNVFVSSTGVIGEPLPAARITAAMGALAAGLSPGGLARAARAIMTTDTYPKGTVRQAATPSGPVTLAGIAKGSGMIAPDMGTMLVYLFTEARIDRGLLQAMVSAEADRSFNRITVDGDTSTSDTLLVAATGRGPEIRAGTAGARAFRRALGEAMLDLAHQVVRDGEGATKFVAVSVTGARSARAARAIGLAIANSPLVKTAIAGEDPNWGRIVMAVGKAGEAADRDRMRIRFGDILVAEEGQRAASYREEAGAAYMKGAEIAIEVDVGVGTGRATVWTCDLTHRYIDINADYRS